MERIELEASKREVTGKKVRFIRREGTTPVNMYGHGMDSVALNVDTKKLKQTLAKAGKTDLISLKIADTGAPVMVLVREIQKDYLNSQLLHVDFYQVDMAKKIKADIPLVFVGDAPAMKKKNVSLLHLMDTLQIEALPDHLPHNLSVDISKLQEIDEAVFVKDIPLTEGITLLSDPEQIVIKVSEARREVEPVAVEAKAEGEAVEGEAEGAAEGEAKPGATDKSAPKAEAKPGAADKPARKG
jgi:large subunit ribosomal protein L25